MAFLYIKNNYFIATFILLGMFASQAASRMLSEAFLSDKHEQWMALHSRVYKNETVKAIRFQIFKDNVEFIESFNNGKQTYKLSINEFADRTNEEFQAFRNGYERESSPEATSFMYENVIELPSSIDWREQGAVTAVKNQGRCGSCWAFSVIAATEGITKLKTGELISLSEQELVDCDTSDHGCNGGHMENGFEFIVENGGIASETSYPYTAAEGTCNSEEVASPAAKITGHENVPANSEAALLQAVANQPISVSIDAGGSAFQFYSSGVFTGECGTNLNHGVTAVGYGQTSDGTKYWLVKNSWGTSWGDGGYIMMERDVTAEEGLCGIAMDASYPTA